MEEYGGRQENNGNKGGTGKGGMKEGGEEGLGRHGKKKEM